MLPLHHCDDIHVRSFRHNLLQRDGQTDAQPEMPYQYHASYRRAIKIDILSRPGGGGGATAVTGPLGYGSANRQTNKSKNVTSLAEVNDQFFTF